MPALADLRLGRHVTLTGDIRTLDVTNGLDNDHPDLAVLPKGEALVTLHVKGLDESAKPTPRSSYSQVYSDELKSESARPLAERTRFAHDVAAEGVAVHALLDVALAMQEADPAEHPLDNRDNAVAFIQARAADLPAHSSIAARHRGTLRVAQLASPAYSAWVTRNSPNVYRRLVELVGEDAAKVLFAEFHIAPKEV